tara:strand:- start:23116 stop:23337 length:222 start_codon:yes stop_codon:yes gene_type:complete
MQFYTDPEREKDPNALPDAEVFHSSTYGHDVEGYDDGYYWWSCSPGCLPDGDAIGPYKTEEEAVNDAREGLIY